METETIIYEDVDAINNSSLGYFKKSPHHFHKYITKQLSLESNADYFKIGTAVHCALLEEGKFEELDTLMKTVDGMQGEVHIISSEPESGKTIDGLGGIAAILRYKMEW